MACTNGNNFMYSRSYFKRRLKWQNVKWAEKTGNVTWLPAQVCLDPPAASVDGHCLWRRDTWCLPAHAQDIDQHQQIHGQRGQHQLRLQRHGAAGWKLQPPFDHGNTEEAPDSQHCLSVAWVESLINEQQWLLNGRLPNYSCEGGSWIRTYFIRRKKN